jgi:hypothetical protein
MLTTGDIGMEEIMQQLKRIPFGTDPAEVIAVVERDGGIILTGALTSEQVGAVNDELDGVGLTSYQQAGIFDENDWGGKTLRLVHSLKYSKTLRETFCDSPILASYLAAALPGPKGHYGMIASHAIEIHPGETAQELHRDGLMYMKTLGIDSAAGANIVVNFLVALTEVTEEMGATRVIPGSGHWTDYDAPGAQEQTVAATMNPGDALFINGKVLHGGGANTADRARRVISTGFAPGFLAGEEAWPHVISVEEAQDYPPRVQQYLGFRSISCGGEEPGFLQRAHGKPLEEFLHL